MEKWDALYGRVVVRVVNNDKGGHENFRKAKQVLGEKYPGALEFVEGNTKGSKQWSGMTNVQRLRLPTLYASRAPNEPLRACPCSSARITFFLLVD